MQTPIVGIVLAGLSLGMVFSPAPARLHGQTVVLEEGAEKKPADHSPVLAWKPEEVERLRANLQLLNKPIDGRYRDVPLERFVADVQTRSGCRLLLDHTSLLAALIPLDTLINVDLPNASARLVLEQALRPHGLTWSPKRDAVEITSNEEAEVSQIAIAYPVLDLVQVRVGDRIECDYDSLIDAIQSIIQPNSWSDGGTGEGRIEPFPNSVAIVINTNWKVHEDVVGFLTALRRVKSQQHIRETVAYQPAFSDSDGPSNGATPPRSTRRNRVRWGAPRNEAKKDSTSAAGGVF